MRRSFVVTLLLAACAEEPKIASAPLPPPPLRHEASDPEPESAALPELERVAKARHLSVRGGVRVLHVSRKELLARVRAQVERAVPHDAIVAEGEIQKLLGLFPPQGDYEATEYRLLEAHMDGYYEPEGRTMVMADDTGAREEEETRLHELVHALQDQHWGLGARSTYVPGQADRQSALAALAEGEANVVSGALVNPEGDRRSASEVVAAMLADVEEAYSDGAPRALRRALIAPYVDGLLFVRALRDAGGWGAVDEAWKRTPTTTEQILHVDKWRAGEPALRVEPPLSPEPSMTRTETETYGEQGVRLTFDEWLPPGIAADVASGWGGDRIGLFAEGARRALLWHIVYDEPSFAARALAALQDTAPSLGRVRMTTAGSVCIDRLGNGPLAIRQQGADLVIAVGTVETGAPWRATMSCPGAMAWVDQLFERREGR